MVAHFRPVKKNPAKNKLNTRMEKLHFAFRMYDLDGDDKISKVSHQPGVLPLQSYLMAELVMRGMRYSSLSAQTFLSGSVDLK